MNCSERTLAIDYEIREAVKAWIEGDIAYAESLWSMATILSFITDSEFQERYNVDV